MKRKGMIFTHLQNLKKIKYPSFVKRILIDTGFDTAATIRTLKKSSIASIEAEVNEKKRLVEINIKRF